MLSLDLFDSKFEKKLHEGALDDTITRTQAHLMEPLSQRAADIRTQIRSGKLSGADLDKLEKEYEDLVQQRQDIIFKRKTKTQEQQVPSKQDPFAYVKPEPKGIPGNVPTKKIPGKDELLKGRGRTYYENQKKNTEQVDEHGGGIGPRQHWQDLMQEGQPLELMNRYLAIDAENDVDAVRQAIQAISKDPNVSDASKTRLLGQLGMIIRRYRLPIGRAYYQFMQQYMEDINETALNPQDPQGDYEAKRRALHDLSLNKDVDQAAVLQRRLDLDREAKAKGLAETVTNVKADMAEIYRRLAPKIERHRDSFLAGQLYDELENYAELHGAEGEFKRMMSTARNRAHMEYDTNPGGFQNWFWFLPFEDEQLDEIDRRGFLKGLGATAGLAAMGAPKDVSAQSITSAEWNRAKMVRMVILYYFCKHEYPNAPFCGEVKQSLNKFINTFKDGREVLNNEYRKQYDHYQSFKELRPDDEGGWQGNTYSGIKGYKQQKESFYKNARSIIDNFNSLMEFNENVEQGVAEGVDDIKKRMSKLEALALAANRAGDDAKCKMYQQRIQSLKQKLSQSMAEGWSDQGNPTPYSVYIDGREWRAYKSDDHARAVAEKIRANLKRQGRDQTVTIAPSKAKRVQENISQEPRTARERDDMIDKIRRMMALDRDPANLQIMKKDIEILQTKYRDLKEDSDSREAVEMAIMRRMLVAHTDLIVEFGLDKVVQAIEEVAYNVGDTDEIGSSDVSGWVRQVERILGADA